MIQNSAQNIDIGNFRGPVEKYHIINNENNTFVCVCVVVVMMMRKEGNKMTR